MHVHGVGGESGEGGEGGESEIWLRLLADARWRGVSFAQMGKTCGSSAKVASVPVIAAAVLPGGATAAGSLLAAAGLSGLVGAPSWPKWRLGEAIAGHHQLLGTASEGLGLPLALMRRGVTPQIPPRGRCSSARGRPD